jgi:hypothetical protein
MPQLISVGQIIDQTWEHYHKKFRELISISAWMLLPCIISIISIIFYPKATTLLANRSLSVTEVTSIIIWIVNNGVLAPIIGLWVFIMTVRLLCAHWEKRGVDFGKIMKEGWKFFLPAVLINVLVAIILFAFWLLIVPGPLVSWLGDKININFISQFGVLLTFAGILAAFVLTMEWVVYLAYAPLALLIEDQRGKKALQRSSDLIHGRYWPGLIRFLLPKLILVLILAIAEGLIIFLINLAITYLTGLNTELAATLQSITTTLFITIGTVLINPLIVTSDFLLFDSLRNTFRK